MAIKSCFWKNSVVDGRAAERQQSIVCSREPDVEDAVGRHIYVVSRQQVGQRRGIGGT